jgi:hypothetical protein
MTQETWTTQPGADPTPAQDREELTDAELDPVAGGGGDGSGGLQPTGSNR